MAKSENNITDAEMITLLRESSDNLDMLYKRHLNYCMNFMKGIQHNEELNKDVFHDALLVFYEKIVNNADFSLTCSIQTYLNSICRNYILVRFKKSEKRADYSEEYDSRIDDWYDIDENENTERTQAVVTALNKLKDLGGKCYEILRRYFYENSSMEKIAYELEYTNADNVKNQKARCQKKLKEFVFEIMSKK